MLPFPGSLIRFAAVSFALATAVVAQHTFVVNETYDAPDVDPGDGVCADADGRCTLRAAVMEANALAGDDVIVLPAGSYVLTLAGGDENAGLTGDLDVQDAAASLTVRGAGAGVTTVDASALGDRVFDLAIGATLHLEDVTILGGLTQASLGGGAVLVTHATLSLERCVVTGCAGLGAPGGGVSARGTSQVSATDTVWTGNSTDQSGGAIQALNSTASVSLIDCTFEGNSGATGGAVTANVGAVLNIDSCTFDSNTATLGSGAVFSNGTATILHSAFTGNSGDGGGGGALGIAGGTADVRSSSFHQNAAPGSTGSGAGILNSGVLSVTDCTFTGNSAVHGGGIAGFGSIDVVRCDFDGNSGGAISSNATLAVSECRFTNNSGLAGGAITQTAQPARIADCQMVGNSSSGSGPGAMSFVGSSGVVVQRCEITGNTGVIGIVSGNSASVVLSDCTIDGNDGGQLGAVVQLNAPMDLVRCTISDNHGLDNGGVAVTNGVVHVIQCTISGNARTSDFTSRGGGIDVGTTGVVDVRASTIVGNSSQRGAGGVQVSGQLTMNGTILAGNMGSTANDGESIGTVVSNGHNLIGDATGFAFVPAAGDLVGSAASPLDPLLGPLQDNGGPTLTHHPLPGSPVVDAGDNAGAPATDQRGFPRPFDGDGDGVATADIGSVESDLPPPNTAPTAEAGPDQAVRAGDTVQLDGSGSFDDNTATAQLGWSWTFAARPSGSGAVLAGADTATPSFTSDLAGTYVVELVVTDEGGLASAPDQVVISTDNLAPTADAGDDRLVVTGSPVVLDGNASSDPEGDVLSYEWTLVSAPAGSTAVLGDATTATPLLVPDVAGVYVVGLVVRDPLGPSPQDTVTITATTAGGFAEAKILIAATALTQSAAGQVTNAGNRTALLAWLAEAVVALQAGDLAAAAEDLERAIERTDGCPERGAPDGSGAGRDWVTDCALQTVLYLELGEALVAITP